MLSNFETDEIQEWENQYKNPELIELDMKEKLLLENQKKRYEFLYAKGTLRETSELVGSSIGRKVCVQGSRKTMLRISYAPNVSLFLVI